MSRQTIVVGPKAWRPLLEPACRGLSTSQANLAMAALRYMHDVHLGLTPGLAAQLARALSVEFRSPSRLEAARGEPGRPDAGVWARVFARLESQFVHEDGNGDHAQPVQKQRQYTGMVPATAPFYYVARIAAPLVARACDRVGRSYLFSSRGDSEPAAFRREYTRYSAQLEAELHGLAESPRISEVFWTDRAFTLSQLSRKSSDTPGLPEVDTVALAQLLRLQPELSERSPDRSIPRRMTATPRYRPLLHRNEGGVDGIHQTRRLADLSGILKSEFLHRNKPLFLERLLQSGYLALRRPPLREKQRDVLLAGVLPALPEPETVKKGLVKAAWFDAMVRVSVWLQKSGLRRSEFLWIEADSWGRQRESRCLLDDLPDLGQALPEEPGKTYRREFLAGLGWLPGYLDGHGHGRWPAALPERGDAVRWSAAAWRGQRDHPRWLTRKQRHRQAVVKSPLEAAAYSTVHVMLFLPRSKDVENHASAGSLLYQLGLPMEPGYSVSVTWVPADVSDRTAETGWAFAAGRGTVGALFADEDTEEAAGPDLENRIAAALLQAWLDVILKELFRDD